MKRILLTIELALLSVSILSAISCVAQSPSNSNSATTANPSPTTAPSPAGFVTEASTAPVTLPVLDALFADEAFKAELKSKLQLSDEQITNLRKSASDEVNRLRQMNAEQLEGGAAEAREHAVQSIQGVVGPQKTNELFALVRDHWIKGSEELEAGKALEPEIALLPGPNAVPEDTRIVVNIPAYRMDLFQDGTLIKSYKIGIGYPQFPLPIGLRKAQTIIFNPTWTPPDEPWVAKMKDVAVGKQVPAGSPLNPLGPIKIPIGSPSLIHGGKPLSKIGTFASHGCVGLTNAQVKDFAQKLALSAGKEISPTAVAAYLKDNTKTRSVKLDKPVPVELRYETIVVEDGKLYIYRDVYDQETNTEENLRAVLEKHGGRLEDFSEDERTQALEAVNAMSSRPRRLPSPKPANANASPTTSASNEASSSEIKVKPAVKKPIGKKQKEVVLAIAALSGKGYPAPVGLDAGTGKPIKPSPKPSPLKE
ncbi:MAG: L,D-transpeptidase family protein [Pyrinomonadaceae bacterium]